MNKLSLNHTKAHLNERKQSEFLFAFSMLQRTVGIVFYMFFANVSVSINTALHGEPSAPARFKGAAFRK